MNTKANTRRDTLGHLALFLPIGAVAMGTLLSFVSPWALVIAFPVLIFSTVFSMIAALLSWRSRKHRFRSACVGSISGIGMTSFFLIIADKAIEAARQVQTDTNRHHVEPRVVEDEFSAPTEREKPIVIHR